MMKFTEANWFLLCTTAILFYYFFKKMKKNYNYWKEREIPSLEPIPIFGSLLPVLTLKKSLPDLYYEAYFKFPNDKIVGIYEFSSPVIIPRDPEIIEQILVKKFSNFTDHTRFCDSNCLFDKGLFQLTGSQWRTVRSKTTPALTNVKLKLMYNSMVTCTDELVNLINENLNKDYELREAFAIYLVNVIASTVLGIQIKDANDKKEFAKMATQIFNVPVTKLIPITCLAQFPKIAKLLNFKFMTDKSRNYFNGFIKHVLNEKYNNSNLSNDNFNFIKYLAKIRENGVKFDVHDSSESKTDLNVISDEFWISQVFQLVSGSYDPLLVTLQYLMYELARYPEIQERAREHVKGTLAKHNEQFTYDCIKDMTFLEQCIQETLRMNPIGPAILRVCTKNCYISEINLEILKGQKIAIPLTALHMDPKYFPEPERFIPDRFPPDTLKSKFFYLPFGDGPRICIGVKYTFLLLKLMLAKMLINYKFTLSSKTNLPPKLNKQAVVLIIKDKIYFRMTPV